MQQDYIPLAASLTKLTLPPTALLQAKVDDFVQRNIAMEFQCTCANTKRLDLVVGSQLCQEQLNSFYVCLCSFEGGVNHSTRQS